MGVHNQSSSYTKDTAHIAQLILNIHHNNFIPEIHITLMQ